MNDQSDLSYREAAKAVYDQYRTFTLEAHKVQADYGKWLISSLFIMHGSAIAGLLFKATGAGAPPYLQAAWWFIAGIICALLAGYATWWNYTLIGQQLWKSCDARMLADRAHWPTTVPDRRVAVSFWFSQLFGVGSALLLVPGAVHVASTWK